MKVIVFAFLLAVASATPNRHVSDIESAVRSASERIVTGSIISAIEDVAQSIRDAGLDPIDLPPNRMEYALPVPSVMNARGHHHGVQSRGLSNIVVARMNYAVLTSRLTFEIQLPSILFGIKDFELDLNVLGGNFNSKLSGTIEIKNIVLTGNVRVSIGVISGISIRSLDITFRLGGIDSHLDLEVQGMNLSRRVNDFLGHRLPYALRTHERDINELITIVAWELIEGAL